MKYDKDPLVKKKEARATGDGDPMTMNLQNEKRQKHCDG